MEDNKQNGTVINVAGDYVQNKHVEYEVNNVEAGGIGIQIINGEKQDDSFEVEDMFNEKSGGIGGRDEFWLLLVAACARRKIFKDIPSFINEAFSCWDIPYDKEECLKSTAAFLKSKAWAAIDNQQKMIEFIREHKKQRQIQSKCLLIANNLFVALKDFPW